MNGTKNQKVQSWRKVPYINQVEEEGLNMVIDRRHARRKPFISCEKLIARSKNDVSLTTCAIVLRNGKTKIGDDVWRLSCAADYCEYPFSSYASLAEAEEHYTFETPPCSRCIAETTTTTGGNE